MEWVETLQTYLPLLAPIIVIQMTLMLAALWDLSRRAALRGPKWIWVIVIVFVNLLGPILYFVVGREEE